MANVEKLSISLEQELAAFVRDKAEEAGQSISAYIAAQLARAFQNHQLRGFLDEEKIPPPTELERKRIALEFAEADLLGATRKVARVRAEVAALEAAERAPAPKSARATPGVHRAKKAAKKRRASA